MTATHICDDIDAVHTVNHAHRQGTASADSNRKLAVRNNKSSSHLDNKQENFIEEEEDYYLSDTLSSSDQSTLSNTSRDSTTASDDISLSFEDRDGFHSAVEVQTTASEASVELQSQVKILRFTYLLVTLVIMLADGLQGEFY